MGSIFIGDVLAQLHQLDNCFDTMAEEGLCTQCRELLTTECATCHEPLVTNAGDLYYEVTEHNDDGDILSLHLVHYDPECLGHVVQEQMTAAVDRRAA